MMRGADQRVPRDIDHDVDREVDGVAGRGGRTSLGWVLLASSLLAGCNMGPTELALFLAIAVLLFGASRLPALGKAVGETLRSFKKAVSEDDDERHLSEGKERKQIEKARVDSARDEDEPR